MATVEQWNKFYIAFDERNGGKAKTLLLTSRKFQRKLNKEWETHCRDNGINPLFEFMMKK